MQAFAPDESHYQRKLLLANWSVCATGPSTETRASPPEGTEWLAIKTLMPVAAALRALKRWSLDEPARRFDAQDWWYRLTFDAPLLTPGSRRYLGFDGLATLAQVWLNGAPLLTSNNMFLSHVCDVSDQLKPVGNELLICFRSMDEALAIRRKRPRWRAPMIEHQQLRWFRTTVLGRTPGWSPPCAVVGPWKDVWLEERSTVELKQVRIEPTVDGAEGVVKCRLQIASISGSPIQSVHLHLDRGQRTYSALLHSEPDTGNFTGELRIPAVALWWPHTHGEPSLYSAWLAVRVAGSSDDIRISLGHFGFRTIALDRQDGNFALSVNGVPVFCRGACWTPLDSVSLRSSPEDCRAALMQARAAGMNMLRVAGTMVYEEAHFYEACSQMGLLIWQDFMFANMDYPLDDAAFRQSALIEARQQLEQLQSQASVALLCGNSEVAQQAAMWGAARELWQSEFFDETLAGLCNELAPGTPYWPSSAYGGSFPHQANSGTTSYYGVGAYLRSAEDARRSGLRFASECLAFANVPPVSTLARMPGGLATRAHHPGWKARSPRDLGAGWDFDDVRDHYMGILFNTDPTRLRATDHDRYLTLSRITTAEVMASAFTEWRLPGSTCNGALVLFLRDLWPGAGWGVLDDAGIPKACFHGLKRVMQPLAVSLSDEGTNGLFVHAINERGECRQVELELKAWRDGDVLVASAQRAWNLPARSAQSLPCLALFEHFMDLGYAYRFGPMPCDAVTATLKDLHGNLLAASFHFPDGLTAKPESDVGLSARAVMPDAQTIELTVCTKRLAQSVHFDLPGFDADNEYFHMQPNSCIQITLRGTGNPPVSGSVHALNSARSARIEIVVRPVTETAEHERPAKVLHEYNE
jgi:beta-mannosidase